MKKLLAVLIALALALGGLVALAEEEEENYDTGDAALDDPLNQDDIGEKEILAVSDDSHSQLWRELHRVAEIFCVLNRSAVVAESDRSRGLECLQIGGFLAFKPFCYARRNVNPGVGALCLVENIFNGFGIIRDGRGVRHSQKARNASCRRSAAARQNILLVSLSRVAEVNVHIHQSRDRVQSVGADHFAV